MNDKHINEKDFRSYGESELSPREFLCVQAHLEACEDCRRRLDEMFPNITQREEVLLIEDLRQTSGDEFHLNYEDHLKPFIYETISDIDKEIVDSHIEVCALCREDLRDLLSFHQELEREKEIRELSKAGWLKSLTDWFSHPHHKAVWLLVTSILIFASVGLLWFFWSKPADEIVKNPAQTGNLENNQTASNINSTQAVIETNQNSVVPKANLNAENQNAIVPKEEPELANLVLPKFLKELKTSKDGTLRSDDDSVANKIAIISPNGIVIRDSSPILQWQNVPNIQTYEVTVFDENENRLAKIDSVSRNSWRISNLTKGKIYHWQVLGKSVSADGKTINFIGQGKFYIVSEQDERRINQATDSLQRGKAFAEAGLLREAANEFRKQLRGNPDSEAAKKWLNQVLIKN